jgi:hypothetical protein
MIFTTPRVLLPLLLCGTLAAGCAAIPLATLGTIAGAAGSAVSTGRDVYSLGKLDTAEMATLAEVAQATRAARVELGLKTDPKPRHSSKAGILRMAFLDDKCDRIAVRLERCAPRLVLIRVDVGWFGSETVARLFLARLRVHLPAR